MKIARTKEGEREREREREREFIHIIIYRLYLDPIIPNISKMINSNIVHDNANVTENNS